MKKKILKYMVIGLLGASLSPLALAAGPCSMNSNRPCPPPSSYKEKIPKNINKNKPQASKSLSGVNASDLKVKPPVVKSTRKEPAN